MNELDGEAFDFHDERAIFFCRGVLETVRKLGWAPDIVHCHGWMSALVPMYLKRAFADDPIFSETKVVYSVYDQKLETEFSSEMAAKSRVNGISEEDTSIIDQANITNLHKLAISFADAVIIGDDKVSDELQTYIQNSGKQMLNYQTAETYISECNMMYDELLQEEAILS
jgi:starch synthase